MTSQTLLKKNLQALAMTLMLTIALATASQAHGRWQTLPKQAASKLGSYAHKALSLGVAAQLLLAPTIATTTATTAAAQVKPTHSLQPQAKHQQADYPQYISNTNDRLDAARAILRSPDSSRRSRVAFLATVLGDGKYVNTEAKDEKEAKSEWMPAALEILPDAHAKKPTPVDHLAFQFALFFGDLPIISLLSEAENSGWQESAHSFYSIDRTMYWAARYGHLHIVKYAAKHGGRNFKESIQVAAEAGALNIVKYLHQTASSDMGLSRASHIQALYSAATSGDVPTFHYLLIETNKAHENNLPHVVLEEALWRAVIYGNLSVVDYLMPYFDAIVWQETKNDYLVSAALYGHLEIVKYLITAGAQDIVTAIEGLEHSIDAAQQRGKHPKRRKQVLRYLEALLDER